MFENTTKAIVISSSHLKGVGPRVGSIGFASDILEAGVTRSRFIPQATQFINGMVATPARISFIRYGYEKERPKYEVKNIISIVPVVSELKKFKETEYIVRTFIDKFPKNDFNNHMWLKTKLDLFRRTDNVDVCVVVPLRNYESDLRTCSSLEFSAWIKNVLFSEATRMNIYRVLHNRHSLNKIDDQELREAAIMLRVIFESQEREEELIERLAIEPEIRDNFIRLLMILRAIYSNKSIAQHKAHMTRMLMTGRYLFKRGNKNMNNLLCKLVEYMFIDNMFSWELNTIKEIKNIKNNKAIANRLMKTKEVMLSMSEEFNKK